MSRGKGTWAVCLAVGAVAVASTPAEASAIGVTVPEASRSQTALAERGRIVVRVTGPANARVRIGAKSAGNASGARPRKLARSAVKQIRERGVVRVKLPLTPAGKRAVRRCEDRTLLPFARPLGTGRSGKRNGNLAMTRDLAACAGDGSGGGSAGGGGGGATPPTDPPVDPPVDPGPTPRPYDGPPIDTSPSETTPLLGDSSCDFFDRSECLYPFPNDRFTAEDATSDTGRRVAFDPLALPRNQANVPVQPEEFNRSDGFSPGSSIIVKIPGLDTPAAFSQSGLVPQTDIARYADPAQAVVVVDTATNERWPIWAELDSNPPERTPGNTEDVTLIVRPAKNFLEGHRYVVAFRNLKDASGAAIAPTDAFRAYRDRLITTQPEVEERRAHMETLFTDLSAAGIGRGDLHLAWDFTVASRDNLSERMLEIRDDAFGQLGDTDLDDGAVQGTSPVLSNLQVEDLTVLEDSRIAREVTGTVTVPCYMKPSCSPTGATFNYEPGTDPDRLPQQIPGNTASVGFQCILPRDPATGLLATNVRPSLYGHGLLGGAGEVQGGNVRAMAFEHRMMMCATDWYGFATTNIPNVLLILQDISQFPLLGDGTQQGMLNFLYLGRAMIHPSGFNGNAAFQALGGAGVVNTNELFYDGNSQGGILGGSLTAVAPDFRRAVLGVPGMNYSTLLTRSVDFEPYAEGKFTQTVCDALGIPVCLPDDLPAGGLYDNYPDELERPLIFALLQMQWDRAEANGYAQHMTSDPLPNTPAHQVLLHSAWGDHQVANVAAEVEARTIGASVYQPSLNPGRHSDVEPLWGISPLTFPRPAGNPFTGSALVHWDGGPLSFPGGSGTPPAANIPPRPEDGFGADPHGYPRNDVKARAQKSEFLRPSGRVANFCTVPSNPVGATPTESGTPTPCYSHGYQGTP